MSLLMRVGNMATISCDVPGCPFAEEIVIAPVGGVRAYGPDLIRAAAEVRGWFHEVMATRTEGVSLERDVCPTQAPGYRTLLAASGRGADRR